MKYLIEGLILILLLLLAAFTAASEIAIVATSKVKLRRRLAEGSRTAKIILNILETPEKFFSTILAVNNIAGILIASLVTAMMIRFVGEGGSVVIYATIIVSFFIIVSEVVAKTFAARNADRLSSYLARPVHLFVKFFSPIVKVLEIVTNFIVNFIGGGTKGRPSLVTEEEVKALIKAWEEEDIRHKERSMMLSKVFDLSETIVRSIMKPKSEMVSIDINAKLEDILEDVLESGYSRLPVYKERKDNIIGVINMKDLLSLSINRDLIVLQDTLYPPVFVAGSQKAIDLLKDFQKWHTHIAIVVDSKGMIEGLVTLEDILEEIVGEIEDEYDIRGAAKAIKKNPS